MTRNCTLEKTRSCACRLADDDEAFCGIGVGNSAVDSALARLFGDSNLTLAVPVALLLTVPDFAPYLVFTHVAFVATDAATTYVPDLSLTSSHIVSNLAG